VPWPERFDLLEPKQHLAQAAQLIREFHDAVTGFVPPAGARWQVLIPAEGEPEIIAYHDLAPSSSGMFLPASPRRCTGMRSGLR
jgi:hypothetical protein